MTQMWIYGALVSFAMNFFTGSPLLKQKSIRTHIEGKPSIQQKINHISPNVVKEMILGSLKS